MPQVPVSAVAQLLVQRLARARAANFHPFFSQQEFRLLLAVYSRDFLNEAIYDVKETPVPMVKWLALSGLITVSF